MSLTLAYPMFSYWGLKLWKNVNGQGGIKRRKILTRRVAIIGTMPGEVLSTQGNSFQSQRGEVMQCKQASRYSQMTALLANSVPENLLVSACCRQCPFYPLLSQHLEFSA